MDLFTYFSLSLNPFFPELSVEESSCEWIFHSPPLGMGRWKQQWPSQRFPALLCLPTLMCENGQNDRQRRSYRSRQRLCVTVTKDLACVCIQARLYAAWVAVCVSHHKTACWTVFSIKSMGWRMSERERRKTSGAEKTNVSAIGILTS